MSKNRPPYQLLKYQVASVLVLLAVWVLISRTGKVQSLILPSPLEVWHAAEVLFFEKGFVGDIVSSVSRVLGAFAISLLLALPLAFAMAESRLFKGIVSPYIDFLRYVPVPTLIPLAILFFGIGEQAKLFLLFMGTFFQLTLVIIDDLKEIPIEYLEVGFTLGLKKGETRMLKLKAILPQLYDNCRISLGLCWTYLIIAELVASETGIGHTLKESQRFFNTAEVYVGIIVMGIIGFLTDYLFKMLYPYVFVYKQKALQAAT